MGMRMGARLAATVDMRFRFERDWNHHEPTVANAALGNDVLGEMADLSGGAAQQGRLRGRNDDRDAREASRPIDHGDRAA